MDRETRTARRRAASDSRGRRPPARRVPRPSKLSQTAKSSSPESPGHIDEAVATELARNAYARERYEFLLRTLFVLLVVLAISVTGNVYLGMREPERRYFATDPQGGIRELVPLERPIQSMHEVLNWATGAITQAYTMNFANYQQSLQESRPNFTPGGWIGFEEALRANGVIDAIVRGKYVATAVPQEAPVVVAQGIVDGRYAWKIQVPIMITYESASQRTSQRALVTATVVRRSEQEHPRGLGIAQVIAQ